MFSVKQPYRRGHTTQSLDAAHIQRASEVLRARLDAAGMDRTALLKVAEAFSPLSADLERLLHEHDRPGRVSVLLDAALLRTRSVIYSTLSHNRYVWPGYLRSQIDVALRSVERAMIALRWAQIGDQQAARQSTVCLASSS